MHDVITFGEAMIRLSPPNFRRLEQAHSLGLLALSPVPTAAFTSEGGFKGPVGDFLWTPAADEELSERLNRLVNGL